MVFTILLKANNKNYGQTKEYSYEIKICINAGSDFGVRNKC